MKGNVNFKEFMIGKLLEKMLTELCLYFQGVQRTEGQSTLGVFPDIFAQSSESQCLLVSLGVYLRALLSRP